MPKLNWWRGTNGNMFADAHGLFRYSVGRDPKGAGFWVARNGVEIGSGLISREYAKQVAQYDADARKQCVDD